MSFTKPEKQDVLEAFQRLGAKALSERYFKRFTTAQGFIAEALGERMLTAGQKAICDSVQQHSVTLVRSANAVGKTWVAARIALWMYKTYPDAQVYTTAAPPESNLRHLLWGEIGSAVRKAAHVFRGDTMRVMHISDAPQHFITGVAIPTTGTPEEREAKFSGKHAPHLMFIVDEGDAVPTEVYRGIESCMSGGDTRLLILYNPRSDRGPLRKLLRSDANEIVLSAFDHPNVVTGRNVLPGAVDRATVERRILEWTQPAEALDEGCITLPHYLRETFGRYRRVTEPAFYYMVMGEYPPDVDTRLIALRWIQRAQERWAAYKPHAEVDVVAGLDVAEFGADENVLCIRRGGYVEPLIAWNGVDPTATAERAAALCAEKGVHRVYVDATGVGSGVAPYLRRLGVVADSVKFAQQPTYRLEFGTFMNMRSQLYWEVREWLRGDPEAMLPPDSMLEEELRAVEYHTRQGKILMTPKDRIRKVLGRSPDRFEALALTFADPSAGLPPEDAVVTVDIPLRRAIIRDEESYVEQSLDGLADRRALRRGRHRRWRW